MSLTSDRDSSLSRTTFETTTVANMEHRMPMPIVYRACSEMSNIQMLAMFQIEVAMRNAMAAPKKAEVCSATILGFDIALSLSFSWDGRRVVAHRRSRGDYHKARTREATARRGAAGLFGVAGSG